MVLRVTWPKFHVGCRAVKAGRFSAPEKEETREYESLVCLNLSSRRRGISHIHSPPTFRQMLCEIGTLRCRRDAVSQDLHNGSLEGPNGASHRK